MQNKFEENKNKCEDCEHRHFTQDPVYDCACDKKMGFVISERMTNCRDFKEKKRA